MTVCVYVSLNVGLDVGQTTKLVSIGRFMRYIVPSFVV
jgi:hypothetical protein